MTSALTVALLGRIPPDVHAALDGEVTLLEGLALAALDAPERAAISRGLTSAMGGVEASALDALPGLTRIVSIGAGTDGFDLDDLSRRGIALAATPDVMTEDTAEYAVALALALMRNVVGNDRFVRRGVWAGGRPSLARRVSDRRVGVVGLGRIGWRVAHKLAALGCSVSYTGRGAKNAPWPFVPDIGALAGSVDLLVLTCAGGAATRGLVSGEVLDRLGPEGFLVNVSRGSVVDEPALIAALQEGRIAGAALDVFANEPQPDPRFDDLQNCVLSPHAATLTVENRRDLIAEVRRMLGLCPEGG